ncbi:MAG TPA: putative Ig domain-containing protein, partial [Chthoniobacteraceae bacterium]|nr:putative Ig domain-containing protein [Chthoniobacteraceae bacterium]
MKREALYTVAVLLAGIAIAIWCVAYRVPPVLRPASLEDSSRSTTQVTPKLPISEPGKLSSKDRLTDIDTADGSVITPRAVAHGDVPERGSMLLAASSLSALRDVVVGETVRIPIADGAAVEGVVSFAETDSGGWLRLSGELTNGARGSFSLAFDGRETYGRVQLPDRKIAYEIASGQDGQTLVTERPLGEVLCVSLAPAAPTAAAGRTIAAVRAPVPIFNSRPQASAVLYLDFDGGAVTDPDWGGGRTITVAPARLSDHEIVQACARVAEDFAPFDLNVTTDESRYLNAGAGHRMRCIVTPSNTFIEVTGGVALVGSFAGAGRSFSQTVPCWVFNDFDPKVAADTISHELGHTLGLQHDGLSQPEDEYYAGHGTGPTSWGPIMGRPYERELTQWSKGEYPNANQHQDDLAIIAGSRNGFGYVPDEAGNSAATAKPLDYTGMSIAQTGIVSSAADADVFSFDCNAGAVIAQVTPRTAGGNLNAVLSLEDSFGNVLGTADPVGSVVASISAVVSAGRYFLRVRGAGEQTPGTPGFTSYGSLGAYQIGGSAPFPPPLEITSAGLVRGRVGKFLLYKITALNPFDAFFIEGALPDGVGPERIGRYETLPGFVGVPTEPGRWEVKVGIKNGAKVARKRVTLIIDPKKADLPTALNLPETWTASDANSWVLDKRKKTDHFASARSDAVEPGAVSTLTIATSVIPSGTLSFKWRLASVTGLDVLSLQIDGVEQARIQGQVAWQTQSVPIGVGAHVVQWLHQRSAGARATGDGAWVDEVHFEPLAWPRITSPGKAAGQVGQHFEYYVTADEQPQSFFIDSSLPPGMEFDTTTGRLSGTPTSGGDHLLVMRARNAVGEGQGVLQLRIVDNDTLLQTVLNPDMQFSTAADETGWRPSGSATFDGDGSAQAGHVQDGQESVLQTSVSGPTSVRFRWKVDSEDGADFLRFLIDGTEQAKISGVIDWQTEVFRLPAGEHSLEWRYTKDAANSVGADTGWVDFVELLPRGTEIQEALGLADLDFRTSPPEGWEVLIESNSPLAPFDSLRAGGVRDGESAHVDAEVEGPSVLAFDWATNTEETFDYFVCTVDSKEIARLSGNRSATNQLVHIPKGHHLLSWTYVKDGTVSPIDDHVWLGNLRFIALPLRVRIDGNGTVSKGFAGLSARRAGDTFRIRAWAVERSRFVGWTSNRGLDSAESSLILTMEPGLELTAHFVTEPFTLLKGRYLGLFTAADGDPRNSALIDLHLAPLGAVTGTLNLRGDTVRWKGQFAADGTLTKQITLGDGSAFMLALALDVEKRTPQLTGTLTGADFAAALDVERAGPGMTTPWTAGPVTALLESDPADADAPRGVGFAIGKISERGGMRLAGRSGDGRPFSVATKFAADGR